MAIASKTQKPKKQRSSTTKTMESSKTGNALEIANRMAIVPWLNDNQTRFARIYATHALYRGNGALSYWLAYGWIQDGETSFPSDGARDVCKSNAYKLVKDDRVCAAINAVLDTVDLNDQAVDGQLAYLIHQHEDKSNKLGAIKEYNRIKNRGAQAGESPTAIIHNLYMQIVQGNAPKEMPTVP